MQLKDPVMIAGTKKRTAAGFLIISALAVLAACGGDDSAAEAASPPTKLAEREECSASALNSGAATLTGLPADADRRSEVATVVVIDVSKASGVSARSLAARCFIRGAMANAIEERFEHNFYTVFLGRNEGQFPIEKLGGSDVNKAARAALETALARTSQAKQAIDSIWQDMLAGRVPQDIKECGRVVAADLVGNGINDTELLELLNAMCGANQEISNVLKNIAAVEAESEPGSDVYGTIRIIDNEFAGSELGALQIVMFSDLLDFNPSKNSNLTKELKGKTKEEATKAATDKGLAEGSFQNRRVQIIAEQPAETAGGTQRDIRQQVEAFWTEYVKTRGANIKFFTNIANA